MIVSQVPTSVSSYRTAGHEGAFSHLAMLADNDGSSFDGMSFGDFGDQSSFRGPALLEASQNQVASSRNRIWALYAMKKCEYIQEDKGDDRTIQILKEVTFCRQLNSVVRSFFNGGFDYPSPMVVGEIVRVIKEGGDL